MNPQSATLIFTKISGGAPVKTRLQETSGLSVEETELLALAFLADTLAMLQPLVHRIFVATEPEITVDELRQKFTLLPAGGAPPDLGKLTLFPQQGSTFGAKLGNAISAVANDAPE